MSFYNVDADNDSANAIVMKHSMEDQSDVLSVRSMPLQKDDDYFYYHSDGGKENDEDDETVDHIGLLIGPGIGQNPTMSIADIEQELKSSMRSTTSEVTSDWNDYDSDSEDDFHYTTQDCIELKLQIADLKAQLDAQKLRYREKYNAIISSLRERNLSLECENVGLKQKLKESQDLALRQKVEAQEVERRLQDKIELMTKEVEFLAQDRKQHKRHSTSSDAEEYLSKNREENYLPFPESRNAAKRRSSSLKTPERSPYSRKVAVGRRPSLLTSLCHSFRKNSNNSSNTVPTTASSQVSSLDSDGSDKSCHYSWANADEINAQTGINKKSVAKLLEDAAKNGRPDYEPVGAARRSSSMNCASEPLDPTSPRRPKVQRRTSFTLGERPASLRDLFSKSSREEDSIDVERELWDDDDDNALDGSSYSGASDNYPRSLCHSIKTAGW
ncbi:hypothetical protein ACHAXM_010899 [Skeletonema potamos]